MNMFMLYVIKQDLTNTLITATQIATVCMLTTSFLCSPTTTIFFFFFICLCFFLCTYTTYQYANQLLLSFPYMPLRVYHQRKTDAISENGATRYHQSNSINLIIGQHKSNFDLFWWMIRHTFAQYANVKQCGTLIQFTVYVAKEKCTETALYYPLMNLH